MSLMQALDGGGGGWLSNVSYSQGAYF